MTSTLCINLFILLVFPTFTEQQAFGSCKNAGFFTCCTTNGCMGSSGACYCDSVCYSFGDCCADIEETCPGSCKDAGFFTCCTTNGCMGSLGACYCDSVCYSFGDCCADIEETCPVCQSDEAGDIRLGSNGNDTRIEICFNGLWGSLCAGDTWDDVDATVACRELGYAIGEAFVADFGNIFTHVVSVNCNENDTSLANCVDLDDYDYYNSGSGDSGSSFDSTPDCTTHAGLICQGCKEGDIRLIDGFVDGEDSDGRVEVCLNNTWGSLCSDSWDVEDATVACRQLGYSSENALPANLWPTFGTVHSSDVQVHCTGNETSLGDCFGPGTTDSLPVGEVTCNSHAGVICEAPCHTAGFTSCCLDSSCFVSSEQCLCDSYGCPFTGNCCPDILFVDHCPVPPVCNETDVRLVGGEGSSGRVEICLLGQWGTVCANLWDNTDAAVVCRQLGLETEGAFAVRDSMFGSGDDRILLDHVVCSGDESRLFDCRHRGVGVHSIYCTSAGVVCPSTQCIEGTIRLQDGISESNGRVEVCLFGVWGTVCDDFWDNAAAAVVCRQLGYNETDAVTTTFFPDGTGVIFLDDVDCTGSEESILDCDHLPIGIHNCQHFEDAQVICVQDTTSVIIGFQQPVYIFSEMTTNEICVTINETSLNILPAFVEIRDITATGNQFDYTVRFGSDFLFFGFGDIMECVSIQINTDTQCEAEEAFLLHIDTVQSSSSRNAEILHQNTYMIITDIPPFDTLYSFGPSAGDLALHDQLLSSGQASSVSLAQTFIFFGTNHTTVYVNQNGILSFERSIIERPSPFPADDIVAIAPFWSEIDFSERDQIYYKESSQWCLLEKAHRLVQFSFTSVWNFFPTHIFTATWMIFEPKIQNQVHNTFQTVLASDGEMSFVILYYDTVQWGSDDSVTTGLNAGDGIRHEDLAIQPRNLTVNSNIGIPGVFVYRVDQDNILLPSECIDGDIRVSNQEILEVCISNTWARICAEFLGDEEASVACQQLGYSVGEDAAVVFSEENEISPVLMNDINCSGGESRLIDCLVPSVPLFAGGSCYYSEVNCTDIIVGLIQEEYTASEGELVRVCATLNQNPSRRVIVRLATVESVTQNMDQIQAQAGRDFLTTAIQLTFEPGTADQLLCVDIPIIDDDVYESDEVFLVLLSTPDQAVQLDPQYTFITISDNDMVIVQLCISSNFAREEITSLSICVQKEGLTEVDFNVTLNVMSLTAEAVEDFPAVSKTVTFNPDSTMVFTTLLINDDDIALEGEEQFIVAVTSAEPNILIGEVNTSSITILDNDRVQVWFSNSSYEVNENNQTVTVCVVKDLETATSLNVTVTSREAETSEADAPRDFITATVPFTFPPGSSNTACGQFQVIADGVALEGNEQFIVDLSIPFLMTLEGMERFQLDSFIMASNCTMDDMVVSSAIITIIDTDVVTVNFSSEVYVVNEDRESVLVCLGKDRATATGVLINVAAGELDRAEAKVDEDFASISWNVTFLEVEYMKCLEIPIFDDSSVSEGDEQFMVTFTVLTPGVESGVPNVSYVTIIDNDVPSPQPSNTAAPSPRSSNSATTGRTVAGAVAGVCIILLVAIVFVVVRCNKKKKFVPGQLELEEMTRQNAYVQLNRLKMSVASIHIQSIPPEILIPNRILRLMDSVGEGEFGLVYRGEIVHPMSTERVAVKTLKGFFDQNQINDMLKESLKMWKFNHPNVMTLIGVCIDGGPTPYIVMPFMDNGSLLSYLKKERSNFILPAHTDDDLILSTSKKLLDMCIQAAKGMEYLASQNFVHKDLAARNCMIDLHFVIKIADFGLSENIYDRNYVRKGKDEGGKLPIKWMALESLTDLVFSEKTDVWAFGVTCWEVFSGGKVPYPAIDPVSLVGMMQSGYRAEKPNNAACTDAMYSIMLECWKENPDERPTFSQLVVTISSQLEGMAGYLDVGMFGDLQSSDETNEGADVIKNLHTE